MLVIGRKSWKAGTWKAFTRQWDNIMGWELDAKEYPLHLSYKNEKRKTK